MDYKKYQIIKGTIMLGILGGVFDTVGSVIALPFEVVGSALNAIF